MKTIINFLGLKFNTTQYKWGRKLYGGNWHLIRNDLPMADFWTDKNITSCNSRVVKYECYNL